MKRQCNKINLIMEKKVCILIAVLSAVALLIVLALALGIGLGVGLKKSAAATTATTITTPAATTYQYRNAAVATDASVCSQVGADILKKNGSAVDAAIASMFCVGVVNLHSTGIGGGGFMMYYNATSGQSTFIDYREVAPIAATVNMFTNSTSDIGNVYM